METDNIIFATKSEKSLVKSELMVCNKILNKHNLLSINLLYFDNILTYILYSITYNYVMYNLYYTHITVNIRR